MAVRMRCKGVEEEEVVVGEGRMSQRGMSEGLSM